MGVFVCMCVFILFTKKKCFVLQYNNITTITDDTFCKSNNTRYIRTRMDEIRMEGNPILLAKHVNAFSCLRTLPVGTYY